MISDSFSYDPYTDRMTEYQFNVNGQSLTGALTWNDNGSLAKLQITDPFFASDNQICNYTHDDLSRIASATCSSSPGWSQTFGYDAFGNLNKSGTNSFQPTYSYLTNQMTEIGSSTPTYDANGNVTNDFLHTYTWDINGRPVTIDTVTVTYDALGRMVEQNRSGVYSEIVYAPGGGKLAIMSGQSLTKAFVPLTGGATAVYNASGLSYYRHSDWLGSSRFASTPSRAMYSDGAYAPFGEPYAQTGTANPSFTGMNQDTVPALYDFPAREYGIQGRWPSPDPAGLAAADPTDPQSWNRYAYVLGIPEALVDPLGLCSPGAICVTTELGCVIQECTNGDAGAHSWDRIARPLIGEGGGSSQKPPQTPCLSGVGPLAPGQSYCAPQSQAPNPQQKRAACQAQY
ncbi:MAG: RHS repeat domain-containing protein, partial [Candidatus Dormibacteria bacterium]